MPISQTTLGLGALAEGIRQGLLSYKQTKEFEDEKAIKQGYLDAMLRQQGLMRDPNSGQINETPIGQEHSKLQELQTQQQLQELSPENVQRRNALATQAVQKLGINAPQGTSYQDIAPLSGLLEKTAAIQQTKQNKQTATGESAFKDASGVAQQTQKDKNWVQFENQNTKADELLNKIESAKTNQNEYSTLPTELATYISGGQRLHSQTINAAGGGQAITTRLGQIFQKGAQGTLTSENADELKSMVSRIKQDSIDGQQGIEDQASDRYARLKSQFGGGQIDPDTASQLIWGRPTRKSQTNQSGLMSPASPTSATSQTSMPGQTNLKVGQPVNGHVYLGGNPNDPNSWQAQ